MSMIVDAFRAELMKLTRNRWPLFWCFGFPAVLTLVPGIASHILFRISVGRGQFPNVAAPVASALDGLAGLGNVLLQIFPIAGAAILFAGEYRWETWRSILVRNQRTSIMLAKFAVFKLCVAASIVLCGICGYLVGLFDMGIAGSIVIWPKVGAGEIVLALLISFAGAMLQVVATGCLVALVAVASRAIIASIIAPFIVLVGAELVALRIRLPSADITAAGLPGVAGDAIQQFARATLGDRDAFGLHLAVPGAIALILWSVVLSAAALAVFQRQDLSKE